MNRSIASLYPVLLWLNGLVTTGLKSPMIHSLPRIFSASEILWRSNSGRSRWMRIKRWMQIPRFGQQVDGTCNPLKAIYTWYMSCILLIGKLYSKTKQFHYAELVHTYFVLFCTCKLKKINTELVNNCTTKTELKFGEYLLRSCSGQDQLRLALYPTSVVRVVFVFA